MSFLGLLRRVWDYGHGVRIAYLPRRCAHWTTFATHFLTHFLTHSLTHHKSLLPSFLYLLTCGDVAAGSGDSEGDGRVSGTRPPRCLNYPTHSLTRCCNTRVD
jgi:hypothetical protein